MVNFAKKYKTTSGTWEKNMGNYISLKPIYEFIESEKDEYIAEMTDADSKSGEKLGNEFRSLTITVPDEEGFYVWVRYNSKKNIEYINVCRSNNSDLPTLRKKIRRELSARRILFWLKYIKNDKELWKIYNNYYKKQGSYGHFKSCLNYQNANFIMWYNTPDKTDEEMTAIYKYLKCKCKIDEIKNAPLNTMIQTDAELIYKQLKELTEKIHEELLTETIKNDTDGINSELGFNDKDGGQKQSLISLYERNPKLRKNAVSLHGTSCKVCGFDYELFYGERGVDYIEVHHLNPLSHIKTEHDINPEIDMTVLCSNCHRMVHRKRNEILKIDELKKMINKINLPHPIMANA